MPSDFKPLNELIIKKAREIRRISCRDPLPIPLEEVENKEDLLDICLSDLDRIYTLARECLILMGEAC